MSLAGYFERSRPEPRMPRDREDELGIWYTGEVLTGAKAPKQKLDQQGVEATMPTRPQGVILPGGFRRTGHGDGSYKHMGEYDPVLKSHISRGSADKRR